MAAFQVYFPGSNHPSTRTFFPDAVGTTSFLLAPPDNLAAFEVALTAAAYPSIPRTFLAAFLIASQLSDIDSGGNCMKIGLPGKLILGYYYQENRTSQRPFLLLRISFFGKTYFYTIGTGPRAEAE